MGLLNIHQEKKKSRGFGFLSFADESACARAVAEHFVNVQNKQVEVKRAEPRTNMNQQGQGHPDDQMGMRGAEGAPPPHHPPPHPAESWSPMPSSKYRKNHIQ